jgi:phosphoribosyl 1,2-cyclic phosphate phosphodiesterase
MIDITFLGTGTSNGIPVIGCDCPVCSSSDPRDVRSRTSAVVRWDELTLLIDTAPELRLQARSVGLTAIDAVLYTHAHADHTGGLDDLRRFNEIAQRHLPIYASATTADWLRERYGYAFVDHFPFYGGKPDLTLEEVSGSFTVVDKPVVSIPVMHGRLEVTGFRFGPLAYVTDAKLIPEESMRLLENVEVLVLNALRERSHPTHLSLSEAIEVVNAIGPRQAYLVHLSHELGHEAAQAQLPDHIAVAFDGLRVSVEP